MYNKHDYRAITNYIIEFARFLVIFIDMLVNPSQKIKMWKAIIRYGPADMVADMTSLDEYDPEKLMKKKYSKEFDLLAYEIYKEYIPKVSYRWPLDTLKCIIIRHCTHPQLYSSRQKLNIIKKYIHNRILSCISLWHNSIDYVFHLIK